MTSPVRRQLLAPAVDAARTALRRLDDDDVPASLRKIAASSARRLPPPLETRLLDELDASEWLREESLAAFQDPGEDPPPDRLVADLFLRRPDGWEERVAEVERAEARREERVAWEEVRRQNAELHLRVEEAERALAEAREESRTKAREHAEAREDDLERLRRRMAGLWNEIAHRDAIREELETELTEALSELAEADVRIGELRDALLRSRRRSSEDRVEAGPTSFGRGSAAEIARALDQLHAALARTRRPAGEPVSPAPTSLPSEIRPDSPEAIDWLMRRKTPSTLLVDGYNVAYEIDGAPDARTRTRLAHELGRIRRLADAPLRPVLFWDTSVEPDRWSVAGVDVRYVPSADEAIVEEADASGLVVVVTGDREVRERAFGRGAVCLWGTALSGWIAR